MIQIYKGIPIPPKGPRGRPPGKQNKYPWMQLEIGDSFLYDEHEPDWRLVRVRCANQIALRKAWDRNRYEWRRTDDGKIMVWRVA